MAVDHDLLDVVLGQVAFHRAKPQQGVEHRLLDLVLLGGPKRRPAGEHVLTVGVLQPLGDHRPYLRLVVAGRGVQPLRAEPAGQLGGGSGSHPRDQPLGDAVPIEMRGDARRSGRHLLLDRHRGAIRPLTAPAPSRVARPPSVKAGSQRRVGATKPPPDRWPSGLDRAAHATRISAHGPDHPAAQRLGQLGDVGGPAALRSHRHQRQPVVEVSGGVQGTPGGERPRKVRPHRQHPHVRRPKRDGRH